MQAEPRKMSIYREEAIDTLISCLKNSDSPAAQIAAAETVLSLQGRFSSSGKPLVRTYLLKHAGLDKSYRSMIRKEQLAAGSREIQETMVCFDVSNIFFLLKYLRFILLRVEKWAKWFRIKRVSFDTGQKRVGLT